MATRQVLPGVLVVATSFNAKTETEVVIEDFTHRIDHPTPQLGRAR